ncbi:hypothetical protein NQ176_g4945 [Zarea fungicola]|uniref:Uncharacterized protein n=1 Tax=Zarea fungicola TaxID=93591 RepID=A0ACC1NAZ9_9HYPO|nr:hypothetical protein NQ176_g4945 [Lecanicillium fungicola]
MAPNDDAIKRLHESKPPATDAATYLTIIEMSLTPEILPTLRDILDDVELTSEIGWDLVEMLIAVPGSEACLERVARLGNPREVILKVLEVMEKVAEAAEEEDEERGEEASSANVDSEVSQKGKGGGKESIPPTQQFVTLCGMLAVLHNRLKVKSPSRFLHASLDTVYRSYDAAKPNITTVDPWTGKVTVASEEYVYTLTAPYNSNLTALIASPQVLVYDASPIERRQSPQLLQSFDIFKAVGQIPGLQGLAIYPSS